MAANTLHVRPLPADLQAVAIKELNEDPDRVAADIEALKTWIQQQPHLRARLDDQLLLAFLRGCKYSLEKSKSKIDKFYSLRTKFPELFGGLKFDLERNLEILRLGVMLSLPTPLNGNGPRIGIFRMGAYDTQKYNLVEIFFTGQLLQEISLLDDDYGIINGLMYIVDCANVTTDHLLQMSFTTMKKITVWNEDALPLRPKGTHFINTPSAFEAIFKMVKPMLSQKQQNRLHIHGSNLESLYEFIPKKYLPKEYGGDNSSIEGSLKEMEEKLLSYQDYLKEGIKYGSDEKLRPGKPIDFESLFGLDGSFRQLNVD